MSEALGAWLGPLLGGGLAVVGVGWAALRARAARLSFERADRMRTEFVNTVSHEFRTPLTSIAGFSSALRTGWHDLAADEIDEFLGIIWTEAEHLSTLVEDILVVPRLEAGRLYLQPVVMDLSALVDEILKVVFSPGHGKELMLTIPNEVKVYADPRRVGQIIRNLLSNARNHGGAQVAIDGQYLGTHYQLAISDTGVGIEPELREVIFEEFERGAGADVTGGIGLGLPIAQRLARQMGGDLGFEPRFPSGSRFFVTFPLSAGMAGAEATSEDIRNASSRSGFAWG